MPRSNLRAVGVDEKPKARPKTVTQAAEGGTARELLVAMRTRIAKAVESEATQARDLAALTKRLMDIVNEIKALDAQAETEEAESGDARADEAFDADAI